MRPRALPRDLRRCSREATTGAATTWFVVKTAAAAAGTSLTRMPRSRRVFFRPQCVAAKVKPRGMFEAVRFGFIAEAASIFLDGSEARVEFVERGAHCFRRGAAWDGAAGERSFERERGGEIGAECRRKFLQARERHFAD